MEHHEFLRFRQALHPLDLRFVEVLSMYRFMTSEACCSVQPDNPASRR
jgi:hypothetical protein